jgi:hypothetical protein
MKRILILIDPQGKLTLETRGFTGSDCQSATREIEAALGASENKTLKPEFYQTSSTAVGLSLEQDSM